MQRDSGAHLHLLVLRIEKTMPTSACHLAPASRGVAPNLKGPEQIKIPERPVQRNSCTFS